MNIKDRKKEFVLKLLKNLTLNVSDRFKEYPEKTLVDEKKKKKAGDCSVNWSTCCTW